MSDVLAINGGDPAVKLELENYRWVDERVLARVNELILSNSFSGFLAQNTDAHLGGIKVRKLESVWSQLFSDKHSVTFNSWTSGLVAAMAALNLRKGSEVIVTPWTMSATVSCIVANDLVPVFADIDIDSFNLSPESVVERLTSETSAILAVDIFGKPCEAPRLKEIAEQNGLKLVIDAAQTPRAQIDGQRSSWYADIAGYSFNRHKHIQVGEGGIAVTDNDVFASRMKLIRNHAEVSGGPEPDAAIPVGFNWRLGEIEAELALFQIESFDSHIDHRVSSSKSLLEELKDIEHLILPKSALAMDHDFYILGMKLSPKVKVSRGKIISALRAEGVQNLIEGYQVLHRLPAFKSFVRQELKIADSLHDNHFLGLYMCGHSYKLENISEISKAFHKVFANLNVL